MNLRLATLQRLAIMAVLGLGIAYVGLLRPVAQRVVDENVPMESLRQQLQRATVEAGLPPGISFAALSNRLLTLRYSADLFEKAVDAAMPRLEQADDVRARVEEPFQFVEFLNESQRRVEELQALAQAGKVTLTPGMARGFPRYQPELARPELLWVQLAMVNRAVRTAIRVGVEEIREVSVEPLPLQETAESEPASHPTLHWSVLKLHMTARGSVDALGRLMMALALTPEELKPAGLAEELAGKPALFIDQVLMRRNQLEAAEQVQLDLVVSSVVREGEP